MFSLNRMMRQQWVKLVFIPLLMVGSALLFTEVLAVSEYKATASVVVGVSNSVYNGTRYDDMMAAESLAKTVVNVAESRTVAQQVSASLNDSDAVVPSWPIVMPEWLSGLLNGLMDESAATAGDMMQESINASVVPNSSVVVIEYTDFDADRAARVANLYIAELEVQVPGYFSGAVVSPLDYAVQPEKRSWPKKKLFLPASLLVGLGLALLWAYIADFYSHRRVNGNLNDDSIANNQDEGGNTE